MIDRYIQRKAEMEQELQAMKKEIEDCYTEHDLVGKRVRVRGVDERNGRHVDFQAFYMGVVLNTYVSKDIYLEILFNKQSNYDRNVMLDERDYRLSRWNRTIKMVPVRVPKNRRVYQNGTKR